ncbi:hypothetical protein CKY02_12160 [Photorhabdus bodei]|nr:hypothetical protein CKY02_12160 [Photorhabdus bodei]
MAFDAEGTEPVKTILNYLRNQSCGIPHRHFCNKQGIPSVRYISVIFQVASLLAALAHPGHKVSYVPGDSFPYRRDAS